jgi:hypothetical protein
MLDYLCRQRKATRLKSGRRKLRLFACACCRHFWEALGDGRSRRAVELSEQHAEGRAGQEELAKARSAAEAAKAATPDPASRAAWIASGAAADAAMDGPLEVVVRLVLSQTGLAVRALTGEGTCASPAGLAALQELYRRQCDLLCCFFGNPFCPPAPLAPSLLKWNGGAAVKLAQAIYEERLSPSGHLDATRLAVLADVLEEAGATDAQLLGHLRSAGPHARGCFAVDAVLGRG